MAHYAVAVFTTIGEVSNVGAGIVTRFSGRVWLLTAAHIATGENTVLADWAKWPNTINIVTPSGIHVSEDLFGEGRTPRFAHLPHSNGIADFMAVPLATETVVQLAAEHIHIFDADRGQLAAPGETLTVAGYPQVQLNWPFYPAVTTQVTAVEQENELLLFQPIVEKGFSGGPVMGEGELLGMTIGHNGHGKAVSIVAIREIMLRYITQ